MKFVTRSIWMWILRGVMQMIWLFIVNIQGTFHPLWDWFFGYIVGWLLQEQSLVSGLGGGKRALYRDYCRFSGDNQLGNISSQMTFQSRVWVRSSGHNQIFLEGSGVDGSVEVVQFHSTVRNDSRREIYSRGGAWPQRLAVSTSTLAPSGFQ